MFIKATLGVIGATALGATAQAGCPVHTPPPPPCMSCTGPVTGTSTLPPLSSYFEHQAQCGKKPAFYPPVIQSSTGQTSSMQTASTQTMTAQTVQTFPSLGQMSVQQPFMQAPQPTITSFGSMTGSMGTGSAGTGSVGTSSMGTSAVETGAMGTSSGSTNSMGTTSTTQTYAPLAQAPVVTSAFQSSDYQYQSFSGQLQGLGQNESLHPTNCPIAVHNPDGREVLGCYNVVKKWSPPNVYPTAPRPVIYRVVRPIIYVRYPVPVCVAGSCGHRYSSRYGA